MLGGRFTCTLIHTLRLSKPAGCADAAQPEPLSRLTALTRLNLSDTSTLKDQSLLNMLLALPLLAELNVLGCDGLTAQGVKQARSLRKGLELSWFGTRPPGALDDYTVSTL